MAIGILIFSKFLKICELLMSCGNLRSSSKKRIGMVVQSLTFMNLSNMLEMFYLDCKFLVLILYVADYITSNSNCFALFALLA